MSRKCPNCGKPISFLSFCISIQWAGDKQSIHKECNKKFAHTLSNKDYQSYLTILSLQPLFLPYFFEYIRENRWYEKILILIIIDIILLFLYFYIIYLFIPFMTEHQISKTSDVNSPSPTKTFLIFLAILIFISILF